MPKKKAAGSRDEARRSFRCTLCDRRVRIPEGWTRGPAVRRHYWAKHREQMTGEAKS